jgi:hypothetical protein
MHARSLSSVFALCAALSAQQPETVEVPWDDSLPPGIAAHVERALDESSRHGEWVDIELPADGGKLNTFQARAAGDAPARPGALRERAAR